MDDIEIVEQLPNEEPVVQTIGEQQLLELMKVLQEYKSGKTRTESRIKSSENWWKLRNDWEEHKNTEIGKDGGFVSKSGWLHNVIRNKHADCMEAYPEANIRPREEGDVAEAEMLSSIIPCVLEQNHFADTYSDVMWQKLKTGTGVYRISWDASKLNGLGDIAIENVNLLNLYWQPGITDIQKSRYIFQTELEDKDVLKEMYPQLENKLKGNTFVSTKFLYDDSVNTADKATVIECYYHKRVNGKNTLQYVRFVEDVVLYATENEPDMAEAGLYDHAKYPYVFDILFPIEGSPCGYGYVDLCKSPQTAIDLINTAMIKNAMVGATPRFMIRTDGAINEREMLDLSNPFVHVNGPMDELNMRQINSPSLGEAYLNFMNSQIMELRETSGNTETATGSSSAGVTAASAIAALQEASGKGSKDANLTSYRCFEELVDLVIELIRQFYDMPRKFRITGENGSDQFVTYTNAGIVPQHQGNDFGIDMGYRLPVFDIKSSAQKKSVYTKVTQNELAIQFFQLGFFNPQVTDQALMCLDMMDFDGKDGIVKKVAQNGTMFDKLTQYMNMALAFAQESHPEMVQGLAQDIAQTVGTAPTSAPSLGGEVNEDAIRMEDPMGKESVITRNARERSNMASAVDGGQVTSMAGQEKQR